MRSVLIVAWCLTCFARIAMAAGVQDDVPTQPEQLGPRVESVLDRVSPSVVSIWFGQGLRNHVTGTIISSDGLIVTCERLTEAPGTAVEVRLADGRKCAAKVLSKLAPDKDKPRDLALVQLVGEGPWFAVEVGTAAGLTERDPLIAIGYPSTDLYGKRPEDLPRQVRLGRRHTNLHGSAEELSTSVRVLGGDTGGPLFDLGGRLVGTASGDGLHAQSSYMSADLLRREWRELAGDRPDPPHPAGARPATVSAAEATAGAVQSIRDAVVEVRSDDRWVGVGVLVAKRLVLTKASELGENFIVYLRHDIPAVVELAAIDRESDLALLRISAENLTDGIKPVEWAKVFDLPVGTIVAAVTPADFTSPAGIVSVGARDIPAFTGGLAVRVEDAEGGVRVIELVDDLNEQWLRVEPQALRIGDVITHVGREPVADEDAYWKRFGGRPHGPPRLITGNMVKVSVRRGGVTREITTRLRPAETMNSQLLYPYSYRYTGFASAFACDFSARPEHCGAPVVDAKGRLVGLLVARAQHIESLVIPASEVSLSLHRMMPKVFATP